MLTFSLVKITNFHIIIQYSPLNKHFGLKIVILTPKMVENIFEIISILTAAKNRIGNFVDTPFDPDYCISSKIVLHRVNFFHFFNVFLLKSQIQSIFSQFTTQNSIFKKNFMKDIFQNGIPGQTLCPPSRNHLTIGRQRKITIFLYHSIMDTVYSSFNIN